MSKNDPSIFSVSLSPEGNQPKYFISPISKCGEKKFLDSVMKVRRTYFKTFFWKERMYGAAIALFEWGLFQFCANAFKKSDK